MLAPWPFIYFKTFSFFFLSLFISVVLTEKIFSLYTAKLDTLACTLHLPDGVVLCCSSSVPLQDLYFLCKKMTVWLKCILQTSLLFYGY